MNISSIKWKAVGKTRRQRRALADQRDDFIASIEEEGAGVWFDSYTGKWMFEWWYVK